MVKSWVPAVPSAFSRLLSGVRSHRCGCVTRVSFLALLSHSRELGRLLEASSHHCLVGAGVFLPQSRRQAGPLVPWVTRVQLEWVLCVSEHPTGLSMAQHAGAGLTVSFMVKLDPCLLREVVL